MLHSCVLFRKEDDVYKEWTATVDQIAHANLEKPLLVRDNNTLMISVNFDPQVHTYICIQCACVWCVCVLVRTHACHIASMCYGADSLAVLCSWWLCCERSST